MQPVRFLERTGQPGPLATPPKPLPLPPRVHRSAGAPIAIALVYDRAWSKDKGFDLFGDKNRLKQFGVWASYDIWSLSKRAIVAAEVGWSGWVEKSHEMDGALGTQLGMSRVHIGANLRYVIEPWLQPHLRVAAGGSFLDIEIRSTENNLDTTFRDWHFAPFASIGAGFLLRTPTRLFESRSGDFASLSMGVLLEGGYLLSGAPSFSLKPKDRPDNLIALTSADLGKLDCSAGYFRISLVVRF